MKDAVGVPGSMPCAFRFTLIIQSMMIGKCLHNTPIQ